MSNTRIACLGAIVGAIFTMGVVQPRTPHAAEILATIAVLVAIFAVAIFGK